MEVRGLRADILGSLVGDSLLIEAETGSDQESAEAAEPRGDDQGRSRDVPRKQPDRSPVEKEAAERRVIREARAFREDCHGRDLCLGRLARHRPSFSQRAQPQQEMDTRGRRRERRQAGRGRRARGRLERRDASDPERQDRSRICHRP